MKQEYRYIANPEDRTSYIKIRVGQEYRPKKKFNVRKTKKYWDFQKRVRTRDDAQCQYCGYRPIDPKELVVHHIGLVSQEPKNACDTNNGVLVCITCHKEIHPWL